MIYLIFGPDTFRSWHKLQRIKEKYLNASKGNADLLTLDGSTLTAQEFASQIQTMPLLATTRLIIVKNIIKEGQKEESEAVLERLSAVPSSTILFFYEAGQPDKRNKLFQFLNQPKQAQEFPLLIGSDLLSQIKTMSTELDLELTASQSLMIANLLGPDLWRVEQELQKISLYATGNPIGQSNQISDVELKSLVENQVEDSIFALTDAFGNRQSKVALTLLSQLPSSDNELGLLSLIASQFRTLLLIADGQRRQVVRHQLAQELKLNPYVFDKSYAQAKQYSFTELTDCYRYLLELDLSAKLSMVEPIVGLTVLASALATKNLKLPLLTEQANIDLE